jgi:hypothetical protein
MKCHDIRQTLGDNGAVTPIGGGFDAEDAHFKPGDCAVTVIRYDSICIDVISEHEAHVYFAASKRGNIANLWGLSTDQRPARFDAI